MLKSQLINWDSTTVYHNYLYSLRSPADDLKENLITIIKGICLGGCYIFKYMGNYKTCFKMSRLNICISDLLSRALTHGFDKHLSIKTSYAIC